MADSLNITDTMAKLRGTVLRDVQAIAEMPPEPTPSENRGPTFRDDLISLTQRANKALALHRAGRGDEAVELTRDLESMLARPDVQAKLSSVSSGNVPGWSQTAGYFANGLWGKDLVEAQKAGAPLSRSAYRARHGGRLGDLLHVESTGERPLTPSESAELHLYRTASSEFATPIKARNDQGVEQEVGRMPNLSAGEFQLTEAKSVSNYLGINPDAPEYAENLRGIGGSLSQLGKVFQATELSSAAKDFGGLAARWSGDKKTRAADFARMETVFQQAANYATKNPEKQSLVSQYLSGLSRMPGMSRDEFFDRATRGLDSYVNAKEKLATVYRDTAALGPKVDVIPGSDILEYSLRGDMDPLTMSPTEAKLDLASRIENRNQALALKAMGLSPTPGPDGKPQAAKTGSVVIARAYQSTLRAIATAEEMGQPDLAPAILRSGFNKVREELTRFIGEEAANTIGDEELEVLVRHELDLEAVSGSVSREQTARSVIPSVDELLGQANSELEEAKRSGVPDARYGKLSLAQKRLKDAKAIEPRIGQSIGLSKAEEEALRKEMEDMTGPEREAKEQLRTRVRDTMVSDIISKLPVDERGVVFFTSEDSILSGPRSKRAARKAVFRGENSGLQRFVSDPADQEIILNALRGKTKEQSEAIIRDIVHGVTASGYVSLYDPGENRYAPFADPVDPGHRKFIPPESLRTALLASAGVEEAKNAMEKKPAAATETQSKIKAAKTYAGVLAKLPAGSQEKFERVMPNVIPTEEALLYQSIRGAQARGDMKTYATLLQVSIDAQKAMSEMTERERRGFREDIQAFSKAREGGDVESQTALAAKILRDYRYKIPVVPQAPVATPAAGKPTSPETE